MKFEIILDNQVIQMSLPMRGAWIEIPSLLLSDRFFRSLPMRGAWIEIGQGRPRLSKHPSLPMRGAWIEITNTALISFGTVKCRSPCGERGLKCRWVSFLRGCQMSLPMRGAWIEILSTFADAEGMPSLPMRGAWIEISARDSEV